MRFPPSLHPRALVVLAVLMGPLLAGCAEPDPPANGGNDHERLWTNPYGFEVRFDGWRAYDDALAQMYEDPTNRTGPRYRIPGTDAHQEVALELHAALDEATRSMGGGAALVRFGGATYYELDLRPVPSFALCDEDDPARDRVRSLQFTNIVGRTNATHVGVIIGAHWDSKRHALRSDDPILAGDDGAASTAAVVELARAFAAAPPDVPLTFVLFDGEDGFDRDDCHPLAGSLHYAQSLSDDEKATVEGMILLDMIGNASAVFRHESHSRRYVGGAGEVRSAWLGDAVWTTAGAMGVDAFEPLNSARQITDDHIPFLHEGIYAIDIIRHGMDTATGFAPYWHTPADDHTAIQPEGIDQVGAVVEATIRRLAAADAWGPDQAM